MGLATDGLRTRVQRWFRATFGVIVDTYPRHVATNSYTILRRCRR